MKSLSSDERKLLIISGLVFLAYSLASIFVTLFFFANSDLKTTIFYRIVTLASMTFFLGFSGWTLRKISSGLQMKISLLAAAVYYLLLFLLREHSIQFIIPLGILDGFTGGTYWMAYNLNQYILTHSGRRVSYFGWGSAIANLAQTLGPIIGGAIIALAGTTELGTMGGYISLFFLVALINIATAVVIGKLSAHEIPQFSYQHLLQHKRTKAWKLVLGQQALLGLYDVAIGTVTGVLLFLIIKNEAFLGGVLTIGSLFGMMASLICIRVLTKYAWGHWIGSIGLALSVVMFAFMQNQTGVWLFIVVSGFTSPFLMTKISTVYFSAIDAAPESWQDKFHLLLERDIVLGGFRTVSYIGLFIFLQFGNEIELAKIWLFILPIFPLAIGFLLQKTLALV